MLKSYSRRRLSPIWVELRPETPRESSRKFRALRIELADSSLSSWSSSRSFSMKQAATERFSR